MKPLKTGIILDDIIVPCSFYVHKTTGVGKSLEKDRGKNGRVVVKEVSLKERVTNKGVTNLQVKGMIKVLCMLQEVHDSV